MKKMKPESETGVTLVNMNLYIFYRDHRDTVQSVLGIRCYVTTLHSVKPSVSPVFFAVACACSWQQ